MLSVQLEAIHPLDRLLRGLWGIITHKTEALALSRLLVNVHFSRNDIPACSEEGLQVGVRDRDGQMIDKQVRPWRTFFVETRVLKIRSLARSGRVKRRLSRVRVILRRIGLQLAWGIGLGLLLCRAMGLLSLCRAVRLLRGTIRLLRRCV